MRRCRKRCSRRRCARQAELPDWAAGALTKAGFDPDGLEGRLASARRESEVLGMGMALLWRDVRTDAPLLARELVRESGSTLGQMVTEGRPLSEAERLRARRFGEYGWPAFWYSFVFMNTVPYTPLVLPVVLRFVDREKVVPPQLDVETDRRLALLVAWKKRERELESGLES